MAGTTPSGKKAKKTLSSKSTTSSVSGNKSSSSNSSKSSGKLSDTSASYITPVSSKSAQEQLAGTTPSGNVAKKTLSPENAAISAANKAKLQEATPQSSLVPTTNDAQSLFEQIKSGQLVPSKTNKAWTSMYVDGQATQAQRDAYSMWTNYQTSQSKLAENVGTEAKSGEGFSTIAEANEYLKKAQDEAYQQYALEDEPPTKGATDNFKAFQEQIGEVPEAYSAASRLKSLQSKYDVDEDEAALNDLEAEENEIKSQLRSQKAAEKSKAVPMNVITSRISEEESQALTRLDYISDQKAVLIDNLTSKYKTIEMIMNAEQTDYQNAVSRYNTMFNQFMSYSSLLSSYQDKEQEKAKANLNIFLTQKSGTNFSDLSVSDQLLYTKLLSQSGIPSELGEAMLLSSGEVEYKAQNQRVTANGDTYWDILSVDAAGKPQVESVFVGKSRVSSSGGGGGGYYAPSSEDAPSWLNSIVDLWASGDISEAEARNRIEARTSTTKEKEYYLSKFYDLIESSSGRYTLGDTYLGQFLSDDLRSVGFEAPTPRELNKESSSGRASF